MNNKYGKIKSFYLLIWKRIQEVGIQDKDPEKKKEKKKIFTYIQKEPYSKAAAAQEAAAEVRHLATNLLDEIPLGVEGLEPI